MAFAIDDLASVVAHWNAADITGVSDGGAVSTLPDSIASWDMTASGTLRPLYRATSVINSQPAIHFDGIDDYMITASKTLSGINNASFAAVFYIDALKDYNPLFHVNKASGVPVYNGTNVVTEGQGYASGLVLTAYRDPSNGLGYTQTATGVFPATTTHMISCIQGQGIVGMRKNGTNVVHSEVATGASPTYSNPNATVYASFGRSTLGSNDGLVAEIVFWDETELNEHYWIEGVLADTYNISLPSWHPFQSAAPTTAPGGSAVSFHPLAGDALHPLRSTP